MQNDPVLIVLCIQSDADADLLKNLSTNNIITEDKLP